DGQGAGQQGPRNPQPHDAEDHRERVDNGRRHPRRDPRRAEAKRADQGRAVRGRQDMPKILLVEDNEMNRDMLSRRLQRKGFEVLMAVDGQQGVTMAASDAPDLILMDMSLPVLDGWAATRQVKASDATRAIPVIALTAHATVGDREKALEAGCDDYDT